MTKLKEGDRVQRRGKSQNSKKGIIYKVIRNAKRREFQVKWECGGSSVHPGQGLRVLVEPRVSGSAALTQGPPLAQGPAQVNGEAPRSSDSVATSGSIEGFQGECPTDALGEGAM